MKALKLNNLSNDRRMRELAMRHGGTAAGTRDSRRPPLPTNPGHAALHRALGVTREYQRDSSSKRPAARHCLQPPIQLDPERLDKGSFYISWPPVGCRRDRTPRRRDGKRLRFVNVLR